MRDPWDDPVSHGAKGEWLEVREDRGSSGDSDLREEGRGMWGGPLFDRLCGRDQTRGWEGGETEAASPACVGPLILRWRGARTAWGTERHPGCLPPEASRTSWS